MAVKKKKSRDKATEELKPMIIKDNQGQILAQYDSRMLDTVKNTVAKNATDEELDMFLTLASKYDLDPFKKEIWFLKYKGKDPQIFTSRDGFVKIAKRDTDFKQIHSQAVYENDVFELEQKMSPNGFEISSFIHKFQAKDRGAIIGAYSVIEYYTKKPLVVYVDYNEYKQGSNPTWKKNASAMIRKVAEKEVCRLSAGISGLHIPEEMPKGFDVDDTEEDYYRANAPKMAQSKSNDIDEDDVEVIDVNIE